MARICIDDELHADRRFKCLARELGNEDTAIGMLYRFWRIAQDYWSDGNLVPLKIIKQEKLEILIEYEFAEMRDGKVYACGSEERFAWYLQRKAASKKAVKSRTENETRSTESDFRSTENETRSTEQTNSNHPISNAIVITNVKKEIHTSLSENEIAPNGAQEASASQCVPLPDLGQLWNENCGKLPKVRDITPSREKKWATRFRETPDLQTWRVAIRAVARSPFCTGKTERGWKADVDWLLKPNTLVGILEGKWQCRTTWEPAPEDLPGWDFDPPPLPPPPPEEPSAAGGGL